MAANRGVNLQMFERGARRWRREPWWFQMAPVSPGVDQEKPRSRREPRLAGKLPRGHVTGKEVVWREADLHREASWPLPPPPPFTSTPHPWIISGGAITATVGILVAPSDLGDLTELGYKQRVFLSTPLEMFSGAKRRSKWLYPWLLFL